MNMIAKTTLAAVGLLAASLPASADVAANKIVALNLLEKGLVGGDRDFIMSNVAENYIQHNPQAADRREGLLGFAEFLKTLETPVSINPIRVLAENDMVVIHQTAEFFGPKVIIDLFRFKDGKIVEHWDSIQEEVTDTANGRSMTDGPTEITDLDKTEANKQLVIALVTDVLIKGEIGKLDDYIRPDYQQHNPFVADTLNGLKGFIKYLADNKISFGYSKIHNVVAEGNFVFTQSEGIYDGNPTAFYDIWRVENGKIAEHWDVVQEVPDEFAHDNGMF
ncbi:MAG: nuclear transport factor 2 family protein [Salaquimonas sp.]